MRFECFPLERTSKASWLIIPHVIERVKKFSAEHNVNRVTPLPEIMMTRFGANDKTCLIIGVIDNEAEKVVGHLVATIEVYLGEYTAFIHQWELEKETASEADYIRSTIDSMVETWARTCGVSSITAMAASDARVRLFSRNRYGKLCNLVRKEL